MSAEHDLTREERAALRPGARVAWQSERALAESRGTVDLFSETTGAVILCDGTWVTLSDRLRLVDAGPGKIPADAGLAPEDQGFRRRLDEVAEALEERKNGRTEGKTEEGKGTEGTEGDKVALAEVVRVEKLPRRHGAVVRLERKRCPDCGRMYQPASGHQDRCYDCRGRRTALTRNASRGRLRAVQQAALLAAWRPVLDMVAGLEEAGESRQAAVQRAAVRWPELGISPHRYGAMARLAAAADKTEGTDKTDQTDETDATEQGDGTDRAGQADLADATDQEDGTDRAGQADLGKRVSAELAEERETTARMMGELEEDREEKAGMRLAIADLRAALAAAEAAEAQRTEELVAVRAESRLRRELAEGLQAEVEKLKAALRDHAGAYAPGGEVERLVAAGEARASALEAEQIAVAGAVAVVRGYSRAVMLLSQLGVPATADNGGQAR